MWLHRLAQGRARYLASVIFFLLLLAGLAWFIDWRQVWQLLRRANWLTLGVSAALLIAGYIGLAWRWRILLQGQADMLPAFHTNNIGNMVNTLLPLRPGDPLRAFILRGHNGLSGMQIASSLVVERWYEQVMRVTAFVAGVLFGSGLPVSHLSMGVIVAALAGAYLFMIWANHNQTWLLKKLPPLLARLPRLTQVRARIGLAHLIEGFAALSSPWRMAEGLFSSVLCWACFWGFHYLALLAIMPGLARSDILAISLGSLALAPPSASSLPGMYQISVALPLTLLGYDRNLLTSYSLVMNVIEMVFVNLFGIWGTMKMGIGLKELFPKKN